MKNNSIYFSSDVKSLSCIIDGGGIDKESIKSLFRFRFIHEPRTIFNNFKKLAPGSILKFNQYGLKITNWYNLNKNKNCFKKNDIKKLKEFKPEFVLISAGFDSHVKDPLAQFKLETEDFYVITDRILKTSKKFCNGKVVSILEGGYDLEALRDSTKRHVDALIEFI